MTQVRKWKIKFYLKEAFKIEKVVKLTDLTAETFHKLINPCLDNEIDELFLSGGRGSTKSSFASILICYGMMEDFHKKGLKTHSVVLRKIGSTLKDSVFSQIKWAINQLNVSNLWKFTQNPMRAIYKPSGQSIIFSGCDDPVKLKSIKVEDGYIKYRWFEEYNQFSGQEEIRSLNQSLVRGGTSLGIYSYNPSPSKNEWCNIEALEDKLGRIRHHSTYLDVPFDWLGEQFIKDAEYLKKRNLKAYKNEYLGEITGIGGEIFKNIKEITLLNKDIKTFDKIRQGLDFGFGIDPSAFIKLCYQKNKRSITIFDEIFEYEMNTRDLSNLIKKKCNRNEIIKADSAENRTINTMQTDYFVNVTGCKKGPDSVRHGLKWLQDLDVINIDRKRCPNTYREFSTYQHAKNKLGVFVNTFPDIDNHSIDSTRYSLDDIILKSGWRTPK